MKKLIPVMVSILALALFCFGQQKQRPKKITAIDKLFNDSWTLVGTSNFYGSRAEHYIKPNKITIKANIRRTWVKQMFFDIELGFKL
ncbi:MAG TPA: hypothetical protein VGC66_24265 [Pyrinomonadaceae bacterium]|jgi:hypothetical protein